LSQPNTDNPGIKDERWVIKTFRPLLKKLNTQHIPDPPEINEVDLADNRDWIIQGMGRCVVVIEQFNLPENIGGMLITSHDVELDYFRLHILINCNLCNKTETEDRIGQKIAVVHEFTHTVAALSAISRVHSNLLIERLKKIFQKKAHAIYYDDIKLIASELSSSLSIELGSQNNTNKQTRFPDEHFRLGFEDFPISYPVIFEEFLLSQEMFNEYFSQDTIESMCRTLSIKDAKTFAELVSPLSLKIAEEKALDIQFVVARILHIFLPIYIKYSFSVKKNK